MDPNQTLNELRSIAGRLAEHEDDEVCDMVMHFLALDQWLREGGFLPRQWELR